MTTKLQNDMLIKIARNELTEINGAEPVTADQARTFADCIIEDSQDKGVVTSLQNAGLVFVDTYKNKRDNVVGLTEKGFAAYKTLPKQ